MRGLNAPTEILSLQQCISLLLRMQILVVDGFGDLAESRNRFKRFLDAVNSAFESLWPYDRYVQTRRYNELWDYIDLSGSNSEHMIRVEPIKVVVNMMQNFTAIPQGCRVIPCRISTSWTLFLSTAIFLCDHGRLPLTRSACLSFCSFQQFHWISASQ